MVEKTRKDVAHFIPQRTHGAFTLIELLVVISIIALLIALLLPALTQARESAYNVTCLANQSQMALGTFAYTEDNASLLPPGATATGVYWPETLLPWVSDRYIFDCKTRVSGYLDNNSYVANGFCWGFWAQWRAGTAPTNMQTVHQPSRLMWVREHTEDFELSRRGVPPGSGFATGSATGDGSALLVADYSHKMEYFQNANPHHTQMGGRHFRSGGGLSSDAWGWTNIAFADGHVGSYPMQQIVQMQLQSRFWFEYPFVPAAAQGRVSNPSGPQPGAEWWTPPHTGECGLRACGAV